MITGMSRKLMASFETILADFHRKAGREHLPWRQRGVTPYGIWVSEILLQQTQVSRVISYYEKFLTRFPTVGSLADATWAEFLPYYRGLGYYARGRNMLRTAKAIVETYGGKFPHEVRELEQLPGVGPYTAAAIASFAYGKDTIAWDTNLRRVVGRFFFGSKDTDLNKRLSFRAPSATLRVAMRAGSPRAEESRAMKKRDPSATVGMTGKEVFEKTFSLPAKTLNAAMMDFGSAICIARPKCGACPLSSRCVYFSEDGKREMQDAGYKMKDGDIKSRKASWKDARVFVILHENHKKYYSPFKTKFAPFAVPVSHNTRAGIKAWFWERYGLELSVRPPHGKELIDGKLTLLVNAQILAGEPAFAVFPKSAIDGRNG